MADNGFKCPICLDDFKNPRMLLPCTHSVCEDPCLKGLIKQGGASRKFLCPMCRESIAVPSQGVAGFPRNLYIGNEASAGKVFSGKADFAKVYAYAFLLSIIEARNNTDEFNVGDVKVLLYVKSITDVKNCDAIVSPTNSDIDLSSGVAKVIANAAGNQVVKECKEYVNKNGRLGVGDVFVSSSGTLSCKGIIHAVGPEWVGYDKDVKEICALDLYSIMIRILVTVAEKGWTSVALCAIGCGLGGIPKQLCAEMYMKAIIDSRHTGARNLNEIHFVDVESSILKELTRAHREWMANEKALDFKNAHKYT